MHPLLPSTASSLVTHNHRCYITYAVYKLLLNIQKHILQCCTTLHRKETRLVYTHLAVKLQATTAHDGIRNILATAWLHRPEKWESDSK
jgi:hypothetical protein